MNVVIIAAIALIVLVVLIMIFTGRIGGFSAGVKSCTAKAGFCVADVNECEAGVVDANGDGEKDINVDYRYTAPAAGGTIAGCAQGQACCQGLRKQS